MIFKEVYLLLSLVWVTESVQYRLHIYSDKSTASSMKIETLVFVVCLLRGHPAAVMRQHVAALAPAVLACVHDPFYKVTAEALRVLQTLVKVIRPLGTHSTITVYRICL